MAILCSYSSYGQKNATDLLKITNSTPPGEITISNFIKDSFQKSSSKNLNNLVSRPSFKKIFQKDFSALTGTNNLPLNQFVVSLNKPEIQLGQIYHIYRNQYKSIPILGLNPYIKGKLNKDDEFRISKNKEIDPGIDLGGRLVINPIGLFKGTGYFFDANDPNTALFVMKNNILKEKLEIENETAELKKTISELELKNKNDSKQIEFLTNLANSDNSILLQKLADLIAENLKFDEELRTLGRTVNSDSCNYNCEIISFKMKITENKTVIDSLKKLVPPHNEEILKLKEAIYQSSSKIAKANELLSNASITKKLKEDTIFEAEKDAPWTRRNFIWMTVEGNTSKQSVNLFRKNKIEEDQSFRKNTFGTSVNYSSFSKTQTFNVFIKYERSFTNRFLANGSLTLVSDSLITGSIYKISTSKDVYDVSKLTDSEFSKKGGDNILTIGSTFLWGEIKKWGFTGSYKSELSTSVTNIRLGAVIPVIMNSAKAEQSNIILELVMPDINTKTATSIKNKAENGQTVWGRCYVNLKVGIPINLL